MIQEGFLFEGFGNRNHSTQLTTFWVHNIWTNQALFRCTLHNICYGNMWFVGLSNVYNKDDILTVVVNKGYMAQLYKTTTSSNVCHIIHPKECHIFLFFPWTIQKFCWHGCKNERARMNTTKDELRWMDRIWSNGSGKQPSKFVSTKKRKPLNKTWYDAKGECSPFANAFMCILIRNETITIKGLSLKTKYLV